MLQLAFTLALDLYHDEHQTFHHDHERENLDLAHHEGQHLDHYIWIYLYDTMIWIWMDLAHGGLDLKLDHESHNINNMALLL